MSASTIVGDGPAANYSVLTLEESKYSNSWNDVYEVVCTYVAKHEFMKLIVK